MINFVNMLSTSTVIALEMDLAQAEMAIFLRDPVIDADAHNTSAYSPLRLQHAHPTLMSTSKEPS